MCLGPLFWEPIYIVHYPITWDFPSIPHSCLQAAASRKDLPKALAVGLPHHQIQFPPTRFSKTLTLLTVPTHGKECQRHVRRFKLYLEGWQIQYIIPLDAQKVAEAFGYTEEELSSIPEGSHMGLSCGNPLATANIKEVIMNRFSSIRMNNSW